MKNENNSLFFNNDIISSNVPTGAIYYFSGSSVPSGWLICNGSAISRTTYANLYSVIGTKYGTGDGSTTFALPNLINRVAWGATSAGAIKAAGLPNISGNSAVVWNTNNVFGMTSPFYLLSDTTGGVNPGSSSKGSYRMAFNASKSSSIYGASTTVQPPALCLIPVIKY